MFPRTAVYVYGSAEVNTAVDEILLARSHHTSLGASHPFKFAYRNLYKIDPSEANKKQAAQGFSADYFRILSLRQRVVSLGIGPARRVDTS